MPPLRAVATALILLPLSFGAAGQGAASPAAPASASFAAAGGEDVTVSPPPVTLRLIRAIETGDQEGMEALSALGRIPLEAFDGIDLHPEDRMDVLSLGPRLSRSYVGALAEAIRARHRAVLLRVLQREDGWVAIFRLGGSAEGQPSEYFEAKISPDGHLQDLYLHWRGLSLVESLRLPMYVSISRGDTRPLASLLGVSRLSQEDAQRWRDVEAAKRSDGDPEAILPLLESMGEPMRGTRLWALERWTAGNARGENAGDSPGLARLQAGFPDDPGLQTLFAQRARVQGDAAAELAHLEAFRAAIAADPLLDLRACAIAAQSERWPQALVSCGHAVVGMPDARGGWAGLIEASGHAVATPTFIDAVEGYERQFQRRVDVQALLEDAGWVELAADPLAQGWLEQRQAYEREQGLFRDRGRDAAEDDEAADEAEPPRQRRRWR